MKKTLFTICAGALIALTLGGCKQKATQTETEVDSSSVNTFSYTPAKVDSLGKMKAIAVLGATGFDCFIIKIDKDKNWKVLKKDFGVSLVTEGLTSGETIKAKLQDYIKSVLDFGVKGNNIHFVVSSGAQKKDGIKDIIAALKEIGYVVNEVSVEQEAKYAFRDAMPKDFETEGFVVDMGSGNSKIAYMKDGNIETIETYGSKYYKENTDDQTVYDDVKKKLSAIPAANCEKLFIIGGVPSKMAGVFKKGEEQFTILSTTTSDYDKLIEEKGEQVKCGINIYKAILDATDVKQVVFDWDGNFSIGVLLEMPY